MNDLTFERARKIRERQWAILTEVKQINSINALGERVKIYAEFTHDNSNHVQHYELSGLDITAFLNDRAHKLHAESVSLVAEFESL